MRRPLAGAVPVACTRPPCTATTWDALLQVPDTQRIYLDLDDVLAETTQHIVTRLNLRFARRVAFSELRSFDLALAFQLAPHEREDAMACVHEEPFLRDLPVREGALDVLSAWAGAGYHLSVITGRPPTSHGVSASWLHANGVPHGSLFCIDKYDRYPDHAERVPLAQLRALSFALAIEDSPEMARFLAEHGDGPVLLMDRPWNRRHPALEGDTARRIIRVHGWNEVADWTAAADWNGQRSRP